MIEDPMKEEILDVEALALAINEAEEKQKRLTDFSARLEQWHEARRETFMGRLVTHLDLELGRAHADLNEQNNFVLPIIPDEQERIEFRKDFHRKILGRFRFNFLGALFFVFLPRLLEMLGQLGTATPLGKNIYFILAPIVFSVILSVVIVRRVTKGKKIWPARRMVFWIIAAIVIGALIAVWPFFSVIISVIVSVFLVPFNSYVITALVSWFVITFTVAFLKYHAQFRSYYNKISDAHSVLDWRSGGSLHIRSSIRKLELLKSQTKYWAELIGHHIRNPWIMPTSQEIDSSWSNFSASFPPSIRIAQAMETMPVGGGRPPAVARRISSITESQTGAGWRWQQLDRLVTHSENFTKTGLPLKWDAVDMDTPSAPNGSRELLLLLAQNSDYLTHLGQEKINELIPIVQDGILESAEMQVAAFSPLRGQAEIANWDEHLANSIGEISQGSPPMAKFAIRLAYQPEGYNNDVISVIAAPSRLVSKLKRTHANVSTDSIELVEASQEGVRNIDLALRIDLAGTRQGIPLEAVFLPEAYEGPGLVINPKICSNCGREDCSSLTSRTKCKVSGV